MAYIAHNMDESENLLTSLETAKSEVTATWKLIEGVSLLRKAEEEKEVVQAKTH